MRHAGKLKKQIEELLSIDISQRKQNGDDAAVYAAEQLKIFLSGAQTVVFPSQQAEVFREVLPKYVDTLEYRLPFPLTFLQFTAPVEVLIHPEEHPQGITSGLSCMLLRQDPSIDSETGNLIEDDVYENFLAAWFVTGNTWRTLSHTWTSRVDQACPSISLDMQSLALACVGYINCENVYLERQDTPEKVNRKRERKGKSRLEPYYICKIRGVNYDSHSTGNGTQHGHRYDVRGHFRRLQTGKVTWVRPHQRGLQNELYIPKTYVVEKQS